MRIFALVLLTLSLWTLPAHAQLWSSILDPSRATNWTQAGVTGGIPNRTTICATIAAYGSSGSPQSAATINDAIRTCHQAGGGVVKLAAGTFYLSNAIGFNTSSVVSQNVTLRGAGPNQTFLIFKGAGGSAVCGATYGLICISDSVMATAQCNWAVSPNTANWTAGYTAGTTALTFDSISGNSVGAPNTLAAGMYVKLDQLDTPTANFSNYEPFNTSDAAYINAGIYTCLGPRTGRCLAEWHKVVSVSGSGPYTVTITPGLNYTYWNSDGNNSPGAWWCANTTQMSTGDGVEDLSIENQTSVTYPTQMRGMIQFNGAFQSWVKNVRSVHSVNSHIVLFGAANIEVRDSYFYGNDHPTHCANGAADSSVTYGIDPIEAGLSKFENNIFHQICAALTAQICTVCVFGYNYTVGDLVQTINGVKSTFFGMTMNHVSATHMLLLEGNETNGINNDHGTAHGAGAGLLTAFRNVFRGTQSADPLGGGAPGPIIPVFVQGINRFNSYIGNVIGDPSLSAWAYATTPVVPNGGNKFTGSGYMYLIGWSRSSGPDDMVTTSSFYRWGNFDYVTNAVRWNTGEIPSGQFVPPQTLPPSFYLISKPTWFGNQPWPAIGPDVTGGTDPSGHVKDIPAKNCFLNVMSGPVDGSGGVLTFNAQHCYGSMTNEPPPVAPTGLKVS